MEVKVLEGVLAKIEYTEAVQLAEEKRREADALLIEELRKVLLEDKKKIKKVF